MNEATAVVYLVIDNPGHVCLGLADTAELLRDRQNLWFSLGMVAFLVSATMFGLQMGAAVAFHEGSMLIVVFNALCLLTFQFRSGTID